MAMKEPDILKLISATRCFSDTPEEDVQKTMDVTETINSMLDGEGVPLHSRIMSTAGIMADSISSIKHTNPMCAINAAKVAAVSLMPAFKIDLGVKSGVRMSPGVSERNKALAECMKGKSLMERKSCLSSIMRNKKLVRYPF